MTTRRKFLQQAGLLSAAVVIGPKLGWAKPLGKAGLQLYSLREYIGKDVKGVLSKVSKAGYQQVETYGYSPKDKFWGLEPAAFAKVLKDNGLSSFSGHYGLDDYLLKNNADNLKWCIDAAKAVGQKYITIPYSGVKTESDFKALAAKMNEAAAICGKSGLKLSYHNHNHEFAKFGDTSGYEILLSETNKDLVKFEMDIYWVVRGGNDPVALFKKHPGRFAMWHVKDMDRANKELNTEIGNGSIDFVSIFKNAKLAGLEQAFVEQENFKNIDAYESITKSAGYLKTKLLSLT
ncbi:TIM barrel protein [Pedobacter sp. HMF7647]|uniref:TIM barrel protein n=1 Tax=Hufsiella arboris TaxID=2695275 RepID=A0A7K1Y4D4_9SPHI|nr:sugar phosphate isomerase/epimerase [Hufsiella arboris]MXV49436.1 TIM barrel protein [Hufsiella arboris]